MAEEIAEPALSDEEVLEQVKDASEKVRVSPLDPDFLIPFWTILVILTFGEK